MVMRNKAETQDQQTTMEVSASYSIRTSDFVCMYYARILRGANERLNRNSIVVDLTFSYLLPEDTEIKVSE